MCVTSHLPYLETHEMAKGAKKATATTNPVVPKRREDSRIQATPEALAKSLFGGATKRPETPPPQKRR